MWTAEYRQELEELAEFVFSKRYFGVDNAELRPRIFLSFNARPWLPFSKTEIFSASLW